MNNNPTITPQVVNSPFTNFCMSIGAIPTSYKDSLDYYETLLWLIKFLDETVIPAVSTNGNAVAELQGFYLQLQSYVNNYFDNLDVQEEINNKLDEMAESGELSLLINRFFDKYSGNYIYPEDYDSIEEAFEAANTSNGIIYLSPGKNYIINTTVELNNNVSIIGNNATITSNIENDYIIKYQNPISPNNWDLFEPFTVKDINFNCNNKSYGAILIDRLHYPTLKNLKVTQNIAYAFKIKTVYWGTFENIHIQDCNGGGFLLCGTTIQSGYSGSNQNIFINCSILNFNKVSGFNGVKIIERSNQNNFTQLTIQNSKTNADHYGYGLYIKNAVNNTFINFYSESNEINAYIESADDGTQSQATFFTPYFGIENDITKCCLYCKDSKASIYNPFYYEVNLTDGYNKSLFLSHHTSGHLSYVYVETDKPLGVSSQNKMLCYYDGTTYTDYKDVSPTSGNFGMVFSKAPYNDNTLNIIFRSTVNPLYVDNMKITSDTTNNYLKLYRYGMFGNQNTTYAIQPTLSGNLSQLPSAPVNGLTFFETNHNKLLTYYNGHWYYADGTVLTI